MSALFASSSSVSIRAVPTPSAEDFTQDPVQRDTFPPSAGTGGYPRPTAFLIRVAAAVLI